jgi:hypothetical protein
LSWLNLAQDDRSSASVNFKPGLDPDLGPGGITVTSIKQMYAMIPRRHPEPRLYYDTPPILWYPADHDAFMIALTIRLDNRGID